MTRPAVPPRSDDLIELLHQFNRKERFLLVRWVAGGIGGKVPLGKEFRESLTQELGEEIPQDAVVFTDYHLDCLYAALCMRNDWDGQPRLASEFPENALKGTQEDIDLLVAWRSGRDYRLILIEAKAFTGWGNKQLLSKATRLAAIFGADGTEFAGVQPTFLVTSFERPAKITTLNWSPWLMSNGQPNWVKLPDPVRNRRRVGRCDESGKPDIKGTYRRVI